MPATGASTETIRIDSKDVGQKLETKVIVPKNAGSHFGAYLRFYAEALARCGR